MTIKLRMFGVSFLKADHKGYADDFKTFAAKDPESAVKQCKEMFHPIAITAVYLEVVSYERDLE